MCFYVADGMHFAMVGEKDIEIFVPNVDQIYFWGWGAFDRF